MVVVVVVREVLEQRSSSGRWQGRPSVRSPYQLDEVPGAVPDPAGRPRSFWDPGEASQLRPSSPRG